ncbi:MAG: hypothetical protein KDC38_01145 [Planctomycetes bacterium]|nr:hypothetical protein [Planctomycetota bacterium]
MSFTLRHLVAGIALAGFVILGLELGSRRPVHGQGVGTDIVGPSTFIQSPADLQALAVVLTGGTGDLLAQSLTSGHCLRSIGFAPAGSGLYAGHAVLYCEGRFEVVSWDYDAGNVTVSSDSVATAPANLAPAIVVPAEEESWAALLDVVADPPREVVDALTESALVGMWVEVPDFTQPWRLLYLQFEDAGTSRTMRVWSQVVGTTVVSRQVK